MHIKSVKAQTPCIEMFWKLRDLREAGWSNRRIGRHLGRSDMVVARCWQQWVTEGRVYRRGGSGRPRNTNDREGSCKSGHFGNNIVASIDSTPLTSFQTSSAIKRNHKETTDRSWLEEPTLRRLTSRAVSTIFFSVKKRVFSDESRFSLSADDQCHFQQDNRPHTADSPNNVFYDVLPWPARSPPDLSPIEHVWTRWEGNCNRPEIQEN
ncbi:HTH_38 domain-containing protein [Trichonephila clavipes]|nr:HTH_38 domain-containing protein [Trichonephila clavipes]